MSSKWWKYKVLDLFRVSFSLQELKFEKGKYFNIIFQNCFTFVKFAAVLGNKEIKYQQFLKNIAIC